MEVFAEWQGILSPVALMYALTVNVTLTTRYFFSYFSLI